MGDFETASIISDVGVSERNIFSVLQRYFKVKLNIKQIFKKNKDLDKLKNTCSPSPPLILCLK